MTIKTKHPLHIHMEERAQLATDYTAKWLFLTAEELNKAILATPTGPRRVALTEVNILLMEAQRVFEEALKE